MAMVFLSMLAVPGQLPVEGIEIREPYDDCALKLQKKGIEIREPYDDCALKLQK
jgi:hypothetical protein